MSAAQQNYCNYILKTQTDEGRLLRRALTFDQRQRVLVFVINHLLILQEQSINFLLKQANPNPSVMGFVTKKIVFLTQLLAMKGKQDILLEARQQYSRFLLSTKAVFHDMSCHLRLLDEYRFFLRGRSAQLTRQQKSP